MICLFICYVSIDFKTNLTIQKAAKRNPGVGGRTVTKASLPVGEGGYRRRCLGEHFSRCDSIKAIFHCNREVLEDSWGKVAPPDHGTAFGLIKDHLATRAHYN